MSIGAGRRRAEAIEQMVAACRRSPAAPSCAARKGCEDAIAKRQLVN